MRITQEEFEILDEVIFRESGIHIGEDKKYLIESRLHKRVVDLGLPSYSDYIDYVFSNPKEFTHFVNTMTTNKTDWFRESQHFDILQAWTQKNQSQFGSTPLHVWSAACSTGEEVYSLAMQLEMTLGAGRYRLLGTDINTAVIQTAEKGSYAADKVQEQVPPGLVSRFFADCPSHENHLVVKSDLRKNIKFRRVNLIDCQLPPSLQFDIVFVRNVLIYFKDSTIQVIIDTLTKYLKPNGLLFTGHSETLQGISHKLERYESAVYKKAG
ncbi:MAG: protein-glutamate O-methyltransferase CheR [Bdellovibrionaceae bacterium]|nr:protein-glutamate O-methyltransferase CheR [Pseudobdellovibrionaceae bacterium]